MVAVVDGGGAVLRHAQVSKSVVQGTVADALLDVVLVLLAELLPLRGELGDRLLLEEVLDDLDGGRFSGGLVVYGGSFRYTAEYGVGSLTSYPGRLASEVALSP